MRDMKTYLFLIFLMFSTGAFSGDAFDSIPGSNEIEIYDFASLKLEQVIELPHFPGGSLAEGEFIFVNSGGSRYYVIAKSGSKFGVISSELTLNAKNNTVQNKNAEVNVLDFQVDDAEYSKSLDRIMIASVNESVLHILDPNSDQDVTINLTNEPSCLSVSPDGLFAAVGHDARISYVDLKSGKVVKTFDLATDSFDMVLGENRCVYVTSARDPLGPIYAINMDIGGEAKTFGSSFFEDSKIRYCRSRSLLYVISSVKVDKINISENEPKIEYRSAFEESVCDDLWIAEDGSRIFTACGTILRKSQDPEKDMVYGGSLKRGDEAEEGSSYGAKIKDLVHSFAIGKVLIIPKGETNYDDGYSGGSSPSLIPSTYSATTVGMTQSYNPTPIPKTTNVIGIGDCEPCPSTHPSYPLTSTLISGPDADCTCRYSVHDY